LEGTVNAVHTMTAVIEALRRVQFRHVPRPDLPAFPRLNIRSILRGPGHAHLLVQPPYVPHLRTLLVDVHFVPGQPVDAFRAGIPCLLYGPATLRGNADEDDACVLVSEMETVTRVLAVTALDVCQRKPAELAT